MVCVAQKGRPVAGVIFRPFFNETYWAWVGKGHSKTLPSYRAVSFVSDATFYSALRFVFRSFFFFFDVRLLTREEKRSFVFMNT